MTAYYNEHDPYAAQWLRNLIAAGHIAPGDVDERSIEDVRPEELTGYTQCHFFAGIGVWSYALRQAGWPDDKPVWTGSCPCQPFSGTGKKGGFADERHLWPAFHWLIQQRQPNVFFGEQVASKDGLAWLDLVQADLENTGYAGGAIDTCAAGFGSPNIRQRLYIVAERMGNAGQEGLSTLELETMEGPGRREKRGTTEQSGRSFDGMADTDARGLVPGGGIERQAQGQGGEHRDDHERRGVDSGMADSDSQRRNSRPENTGQETRTNPRAEGGGEDNRPGPTNGFWRDADWLGCRDGKWRPVEPGTSPLVNGLTNRVGRLRAYGNAINAEAATEFIKAYIGP